MAAPLTSVECELLEGAATRDENVIAVLADYWIEHVDPERGAFVMLDVGENAGRIDLAEEEARLSVIAQTWRAPLIAAGYAEHDLVLSNGFLQYPLAIAEGNPLDGDPDVVRISPRYYRIRDRIRTGVECLLDDAQAVTPRTLTRVAVKSAAYRERQDLLVHELALLSRIRHRNVVRPLDIVICTGGMRALALEWCGTDLRGLLASARSHGVTLGIDFAMSVAAQVLDGVVALHAAGIQHRELRTDHIMIAADGTVRLIDFGCAQMPGRRFDRYDRYISPGYPGDMRYRVQYMSPEMCRGLGTDASTDVFSAALVIAELAAGVHPLDDIETAFGVLQAIVMQLVELPNTLPAPLQIALRTALEPNPELRPTAEAFRDTLVRAAEIMRVEIGPHVIARRLVELGVPV